MRFFSEFISVFKTFRSQRNDLYLIALNRKPTTLAKMDFSLQKYLSYVTPYAFSHINRQWEASKSPLNDVTCYNTTINHYDCNLMKSMGLLFKHLFHRRLEMGLMIFNASLIKNGWTQNYYNTLSVPRFSKDDTPKEENNLNDNKKNSGRCYRRENCPKCLTANQKN